MRKMGGKVMRQFMTVIPSETSGAASGIDDESMALL